jgi:tRNA-Thr(GGU) m(6)t(6)A37 methyltransferase TsaA
MELQPIGRVSTSPGERTASQSAENTGATGELVLLDEFAPALRGLEGFDYAWLIAYFDRLADEPPRLEEVPNALRETGQTFGVFATRSPARPNNLGLSLVRILGIDGVRIRFAGVDLLDGTPILDIKPYIPSADVPAEADAVRIGWLGDLG